MKHMHTKRFSGFHFSFLTGITVICLLFSNAGFGQTYYSKFANDSGKYQITNASGDGCNAPAIIDPGGFADSSDTTFAYFEANTPVPFTCLTSDYSFLTSLNLPPDTESLDSGYTAGFFIRIPTAIGYDSLSKYVVLSTYLNGVFQEYHDGSSIQFVDSMHDAVEWYIYFTSIKPFNVIDLSVDPRIVQLNTDFVFDVIYAVASKASVLPAQIANFALSPAGKTITVSWTSLTETNVNNYTIQRSSNGGALYTSIASLEAKSNSGAAASYRYTDKVPADGNYLYRIVTVNKDGSSKTTGSLAAVIKGDNTISVYPSVVKAGQTITVKTLESSAVTVQLFDARGSMVKQQRSGSGGQFTMSTGGLSIGIYLVKIISATGNITTSRIVVN